MNWDNIPYFKEIMEKQCEFANVEFEDIDFDSQYWFQEVTWTKAQEDAFKSWVVPHLASSIKIRREMCSIPHNKSKKHLLKWFDSYNFMYGFKLEEI